jgi:hypothetical protein
MSERGSTTGSTSYGVVPDVEPTDQDRPLVEDDEADTDAVDEGAAWEVDPADAADQRRAVGWPDQDEGPA